VAASSVTRGRGSVHSQHRSLTPAGAAASFAQQSSNAPESARRRAGARIAAHFVASQFEATNVHELPAADEKYQEVSETSAIPFHWRHCCVLLALSPLDPSPRDSIPSSLLNRGTSAAPFHHLVRFQSEDYSRGRATTELGGYRTRSG
jgi:hypothetical protein